MNHQDRSGSSDLPQCPRAFRLEEWLVEPSLNRLRRGQEAHHLEPRVMRLLCVLARDPGSVKSKDELLEAVWPGTHVTDNVLAQAVADLRRTLGDDWRDPRYIATISKTGYRLVAAVRSIDPPPQQALPSPIPPQGLHENVGRRRDARDGPPVPGSTVQARQPRALPQDHDPRGGAAPSSDGSEAAARGGAAQGSAQDRRARPPMANRPSRAGWVAGGLAAAAVLLMGWVLLTRSAQGPAPQVAVPTPLTTLPGREVHPALSPGGEAVAFAWPGPQGGNWDIYVQVEEGASPRRLTRHEAIDHNPAWTPDGRLVSFIRGEGDDCAVFQVAPLTGGPERKLTDCRNASSLAWSPNGKLLLLNHAGEEGQPSRLAAFDTVSGRTRFLTDPPADSWGDMEGRFSPDGRWIAFRRIRTEYLQDLYLIPASGGPATRLTSDTRTIPGFAWSPEGSRLIFASSQGGRSSLWTLTVPPDIEFPHTARPVEDDGNSIGGSNSVLASSDAPADRRPGSDRASAVLRTPAPGMPSARPLPVAEGSLTRPAASLRSSRLAYVADETDIDVWSFALMSPAADSLDKAARQSLIEGRTLLDSSAQDARPAFSPDGRRIAFISTRSGHHELWTSRDDGSQPLKLTSLRGPFLGSPAWTSDGRRIAFEVSRAGQSDIYWIGAEEGTAEPLLDPPSSDEVHPVFSRDGRSFYFASNRRGAWQIFRQPLGGGPARQVTAQGGYACREGLGGHYLYFSKYDRAGLWRLSLTTAEQLEPAPQSAPAAQAALGKKPVSPAALASDSRLDGSGETLLTDLLQPMEWGNWGLDAEGIVFLRRSPQELLRYRFNDGTLHVIARPLHRVPSDDGGLALSLDGTLLLSQAVELESDIRYITLPSGE